MVEAAPDADEHINRDERSVSWFLRLAFGLLWAFLSYLVYVGIVGPMAGARPLASGLGLAWLPILLAASVAVTWAFKEDLLGR